jgi:hypothetical protein
MNLKKATLLSFTILFLGSLVSCTSYLVGPNEPNSSLVIGRIVVDNKYPGGLSGLLPLGMLDKALDVEVETRDGKQYFKVTTEEQGYFLIPNLPPNSYHLLSVIIEGRRSDGSNERYAPRLRRPIFTPVPGKVTYIGTLYIDLSDRGESKIREVREDDRAKTYFLQKYAASPWSAREFTSVGAGAIAGAQIGQTKTPTVDAKTTASSDANVDKPEWKIGYNWMYAWKQPGSSGTLTREIVREDTFEGVPAYVMRVGKNEYFLSKNALGDLAGMLGGKVTYKRTPPDQDYSWPFQVGKEWKSKFLRENVQEKSSQTYDYRKVVAAIEKIQVPAGAFDAFKIQTYESYSGNLLSEGWYSPVTKWFIKLRTYRQDGLREEELISFKAD